MKAKPRKVGPQQLAVKISDELMNMYPKKLGMKATRLALMQEQPRGGERQIGGLCRSAVIGRILFVLKREVKHE